MLLNKIQLPQTKYLSLESLQNELSRNVFFCFNEAWPESPDGLMDNTFSATDFCQLPINTGNAQ